MREIVQVFEEYKEKALTKKGALLLATARGRLGEGIDFTDELARAVYIIGCPNINTKDIYVK